VNPLEELFSVYLIPVPPFLARLQVEEVKIGSRLVLFRYSKANGKPIKYQLCIAKDGLKVDPDGAKFLRGPLLSRIQFLAPDPEFISFLMAEDVTNLPYAGWPQRKNSGPFMCLGRYDWHWQDDGKYLAAFDDSHRFILENREARLLAERLCRRSSHS
jgi:hypothetical protein